MALTLTDAAKLSNDTLLRGVIDTVASEDELLPRLPIVPIVGNSLTYNRLNTAPTASWMAVGDTWTEGTPTFNQITAAAAILGGDADIDNFIASSRSNVQDLEAEIIQQKALAVWRELSDTLINGDSSADPKQPEGFKRMLSIAGSLASQTIASGANGAALTLDRLDELVDTVRNGPCDAIIMSRRTRRSLLKLWRNSSSSFETRDEFGRRILLYNGIPILISDYISDTETVGTSTDCSRIYAVRFGTSGVAFAGVPGTPAATEEERVLNVIRIEHIGSLETKDATRWRVKMYGTAVLFDQLGLAQLSGVRPA